MSLVDVLEDERRETADTDSSSASRRGLKDSFLAVRNMLDIPSNTSTPSSSRERRSSPFAAGNGDAAQSTLGNKATKQSASAEAMAAIFGGAPKDFQISSKTRGSGRHNSTVGIGAKSRSPSSRLHRSSSPGIGLLNNNRSSPMHIMTDSSDFNDIDSATEKASDSNLKPKGKGPDFVSKDNAENGRRGSADSSNDIRLEEDRPGGEGADERAIESSDDEEEVKSSEEDEDESTPNRKRGRGRKRIDKGSDVSNVDSDESEDDPYASLYGQNESTSQAKSALAAAEEERMAQSKAKLRPSEPAVSVIGPGGERLVPKKGGVHPNTSYDYTASGMNSANSSDADISDIRRAQKLSINMSHIDTSVPNRVIRTILRGDFSTMQEDAEEGLRRSRLYLVATDLSDEAVYALEWTIGTILRDGDTLLAIYAVDEETGTGKSIDADASGSVQIGEGAKAAQDTVDAMTSQTEKMNQSAEAPSLLTPAGYLPATSTDSRPGSVDSRMLSKAEIERQRAIEDISSTCVRLLRKTKLQVRVAIEVIHCKSPKHMITEAIDGLEPTLVILGSRGRSALKGVLLGSFSNYLVTKSSIPVMVARKKLRKHAKFKKTNIRLSNNLQRPNRLTSAKID
ncbi:hypothetical protein EPUS_07370 [Endocarpon pusillum Z07020]|uniref:UspA domain-containing protein n=1 Tax=Endocarpon pusillum (strain Z07020 / HMAS-L-300199) TaxID=1263415 RepID=U1GEI7_ENDPU|nr:uncharacterized protein EPUS_07370 [Endocarpon pusillum Z07020]ERF70513.1 hypothetical protein EPUS_07370 [Endocarpon pusillum Z07020]